MKILLLTHAFHPQVGGLETVARVLADEFAARGHEVRVVTQSAAGAATGADDDDAPRFDYPVIRRPDARELLRLTRWCDIFFQNNISLQTLWPLLLVRRPWVVAHQTWLTRVNGSVGWQDRLKTALIRFGSPVAISRAVAAPLPVRAELIGNPYSAEVFRRLPDVPRERSLVFLGRLVSDKGADLLLEALAILKADTGSAPDLTVVGDGPELPALRALAERLGIVADVTFLGQLTGEALVRTLNAHRVMVVPSRLAEPFGVVALEGAACGCVVIGSEGGGLPDAIGPCGLLFPNGDARALAAAIQRALTDDALRAQVEAAAPEHLSQHSPRQIAAAYLRVFEHALGERSSRNGREFPMLLLTHPLGNANVRQAALAMAESGLLSEFCTCLHADPNSAFARSLPERWRREWERRTVPESVRAHTTTAVSGRELGRHVFNRLGRFLPGARWLVRHERGPFSVDAVFRAFDRAVAEKIRRGKQENWRGVYAYEDAAAETFRAAAERGLRRCYDLPIGYWRAGQKIFSEEAERQPEWAQTLTGRADSVEKLARKDAELAGADAVVVASNFTRETLAEAPGLRAPVHVVPYGAPDPISDNESNAGMRRAEAGAPLRVLFAGSLGQRKGLSYLLEAVALLGSRAVELTLLGQKTASDCAPLERATRQHRWIPSLPHAALLDEMTRQDVLVFPSLFEGFGLVLLEAMSRGLPVIATAHSAAPDVLSADGVEGFLVPIRSAQAIAEKLEILHRDRARLAGMRRAALARAAASRWCAYRRSLAAHVAAVLGVGAEAANI